MADLRNQRRMASTLLKCGANRVWMDHDRIDEIAKAVTKDDVRILIRGEAIKSKQIKGISRGRKKTTPKAKPVEKKKTTPKAKPVEKKTPAKKETVKKTPGKTAKKEKEENK